MASGMSKRFGSNKLLADFHGEPMIMRILRATDGLFTRRVVVTRHAEVSDLCRTHGVSVVLHDRPHRSDTVRLGLEAIGDADCCMFCPADQPLLRRETIAALLASASADRDSIWRPCFGENPGSPVLFPRWAFDQLLCLPEGKGGGYVIRQYPDRVRTIPVRDEYELTDADDRETYARLLQADGQNGGLTMHFHQEAPCVYRLWVPFENLNTSVFLLLTPEGPVLYDCATTAQDVEAVILPALAQMGIRPEQLHAIVVSHAHGDHCGGLATLLQHAPQLRVVAVDPQLRPGSAYVPSDGELLFGCMQALYLPGHTADCLALYDRRNDLLLTADALQLQGIGRYGCAVTLPDGYAASIARIRTLAPHTILTSHPYAPYGEKASDPAEVARYLDGCLAALEEIRTFTLEHPHQDAETIAAAFRAEHPQWPLLPAVTVRSLQKST